MNSLKTYKIWVNNLAYHILKVKGYNVEEGIWMVLELTDEHIKEVRKVTKVYRGAKRVYEWLDSNKFDIEKAMVKSRWIVEKKEAKDGKVYVEGLWWVKQ